jgi:hypothetical protein
MTDKKAPNTKGDVPEPDKSKRKPRKPKRSRTPPAWYLKKYPEPEQLVFDLSSALDLA